MKTGLKVYNVQFDSEWDIVEASSFGEAVDIWRSNLEKENGCSYADEEPEQVHLLSDKAVLRKDRR